MVAKKRLKVEWSEKAAQSLEKIYKDIKRESPSAARQVRSEIFKTTKALPFYPEKFQLDEYYPDNLGTIRRCFCWSYRIVYEVNKEAIDILNVIHTSKHPDKIGE